jgi:uncharacterized protein YdbL (DUF1318 family)
MKKIKRIALPLLFSLPLTLLSCVTINVNIPEGAVQQASDDYVKDLYEAKERDKKPAPNPSASPRTKSQNILPFDIESAAFADEPTVKTDSDKAQEIKARMKARLDDVTAQKDAGVFGEGNDGKLALKGKPAAANEKKIKKLLADENSDRDDLYHEIIRHNGMDKAGLTTIEKNFAHAFQKHSPTGSWMQDDDGTWFKKP